jgi:hypothetical protein
MGAETFSDFLIPLKFSLDEPSKKKFDAAILETEKRFKEIGTAAVAAATALAFAVREISKNLAGLAYAAERVGASSEKLKALGNAADRVGIGAEAAKSSLSAFFAFVNFEGGASAIKQWFNIDFDPKHPLKAMLDSAVKLADEYANGSVARRQTAIREAQRAGIDERLLTTPGAARRLRDEMEKDEAFTGGKLNPIAEKAKRLNAEFEKVKQHLRTISELVSGSLQDAFSDLLEKADGWLKAHRDDIIWFGNKAAEIAKGIAEVTKHEISLLARLEANTAELMRTQDIIKTIREGLKWLGEGSIANKINAALEWAFQPFKWLWDKLQSLGLVGAGGIGSGGSFGPGAGTESGGHGAERRGKFGHGGTVPGARGGGAGGGPGGYGTPLAPGSIGAAGSLTALITAEANRAGIDPRIMEGIRAGESAHGAKYDVKDDSLESSWGPFQLNRRRGLGVEFERDTAAQRAKLGFGDLRDPRTIPLQARWVANYIKRHGGTNAQWMGYRGPRDANPKWGESGYTGNKVDVPPITKVPSTLSSNTPSDFHKALETIRSAKPLTPWQQSMNEHHDNRVFNSNVDVKVAGAYPIDKTAHPLERTKNATLVRNTTATAS